MIDMVCIVCPLSCMLKVDTVNKLVAGNKCKRGEAFGLAEITCPMRTISTVVKTSFAEVPVLPVRVSSDIPKDKIFEVMNCINSIVLDRRVRRGDVIIADVLGLGVDVIATSSMLYYNEEEKL